MSGQNITLIVVSDFGEIKEQFDTRLKVSYLKTRALMISQIRAFSTAPKGGMFTPSQADRYYIIFEGIRLQDDKILGELGLPDGARVFLKGPFLHGLF
jgi:hypothetical protein